LNAEETAGRLLIRRTIDPRRDLYDTINAEVVRVPPSDPPRRQNVLEEPPGLVLGD
jgi:hypothetical protein